MFDVKSLRTAGATLLAPVSWGTTYVVITELLPAGRPLLVAGARVVPAGLVLLAVAALAGRRSGSGARPRLLPEQRGDWGRTALLALFNFGLFFPLLVVAVYRLPGGVAAAVGGLQPLLVALVSWLVVARRPQRREIAVGIAAVVGVALVVVRPGAAFDAVGLLAAVGANVSFSIGVVLTKRFPPPADRLAATGWQLLLGGVLLVPLALAVEGLPPAPTGEALAGYAYLSLGATALAFVLWFNGVRRLTTAAPPLLGLAAPVTGAVLGWALLGQSLSPLQLAGFALTLTAIAYGATLGASSTPTPTPTPALAVASAPTSSCGAAPDLGSSRPSVVSASDHPVPVGSRLRCEGRWGTWRRTAAIS
jgi:probable blue pigment (indigoidine) exporter